MMSGLTKLTSLSLAEASLLVEATAALGASSAALALMPFRKLEPFLSRSPSSARVADLQRCLTDVSWSVRASARRVPFRAKCFEQAIAAAWMLRRRGIPVTIHYGVAHDKEALVGHVWLTAGEHEVVGCENASGFHELTRFP